MRLGVIEEGEEPVAILIEPDGGAFRRLTHCVPELGLPPGAAGVTAILAEPRMLAALERGAGEAASEPLDRSRLLAPVAPRRIIGIGLNYRSHAQEVGREPGEVPAVFLKDLGALAGPFGSCRMPGISPTLDYEAELAVVLCAPLHEVDEQAAAAAIGGYAVANDLTLRAFARPETLAFAKGLPGACPLGPWVTAAAAVPEPSRLVLRSFVNGERRQEAEASEMIFPIARLLSIASSFLALMPGDVVLTGSPAGTGAGFDPPRWLKRGDEVRVEIDTLGLIETRVV
jgi:2-keto-4-pentenoate hydratase/2-oxohepta-3-ene-1,7-dioic acid hydratase in catechol pathway